MAMVFGSGAYVLRDRRKRRIWAKLPGTAKPVACGEDNLKQRIMDQLQRWPPPPDRLARICSCVFGTHAENE